MTSVEAPRTLRLTGTLRGERETDLAANVAGRVISTKIERGQRVEKGELIAQVDVSGAALALAEARVAVQTSKTQEAINQADCDRYERLKASNAVTDLEYDQVTAKCKTAPLNREAAERARTSPPRTSVTAGSARPSRASSPIATSRWASTCRPRRASPRSRRSRICASSSACPSRTTRTCKLGAKRGFRVAAYGSQLFSGTVSHISGAVRETRDVVVEASVKNPDHKLLPGMFADVELTVGHETLPSIPKARSSRPTASSTCSSCRTARSSSACFSRARRSTAALSVRRGVVARRASGRQLRPELKNGQRVK